MEFMKIGEILYTEVEDKIVKLRNQNVILASDVAKLYGVGTRDINKSVKNNPDKFPKGYIIELTADERSEVVEIFHHLENLKFSPILPNAFTEKGLYMLATILKSTKATATTLAIIETFTKNRELSRIVAELPNANDWSRQKELTQKSGEIMTDLFVSDQRTTESETTIELNFAILKLKHTIKKSDK
jgi:hypothetical protein